MANGVRDGGQQVRLVAERGPLTFLMPAHAPIVSAVVERIEGSDGVLGVTTAYSGRLPEGTSAWPVRVAIASGAVAVYPTTNPHHDEIAARLTGIAGTRTVADPADALASVVLDGEAAQLLDRAGQPVYARPLHVSPSAIDQLAQDARTLRIAEQVRELPSGSGFATLESDVDISVARVLDDSSEVALASGEHLFTSDRLRIHFHNKSTATRYASVFDIGLAGRVSQLTTVEPSGVTLGPGERYAVGTRWSGGSLPLVWPDRLPAGEPREETFVMIVADRPVDGLRSLGQPGAARAARGSNTLERMLGELTTGRREVPPADGDGVRWSVRRFDFLLHAASRPMADEPRFDIDERPDASLRSLVPRGVAVPARVSVRLNELTVHSNRALLRSRVRIDCMVITAAPAESGDPYRASTMRFDRIKSGDRLPFDKVLVYDGPVNRFLDIAIWVAKDDSPDVDLADLFAKEAGSKEVATALTALAGLAVAAPAAAAVAGSVAAVAVLVRTAARLIDKARGASIGVYRTTLLPHERFGASTRHPAGGLLRAQDMSFAFEVIAPDSG